MQCSDLEVAHPQSGSLSTFLVKLEFENVGFWGEGKPSAQRKTSWSKRENQWQTHPTYVVDAGIWTWATLVGGECSHHCIILPPFQSTIIKHLQEHLQTNWFALKCAHCNNDISDKQACAAGPRNLILVIKVCEAVLISLFWAATDSMNYQKCVLISFHLD